MKFTNPPCHQLLGDKRKPCPGKLSTLTQIYVGKCEACIAPELPVDWREYEWKGGVYVKKV